VNLADENVAVIGCGSWGKNTSATLSAGLVRNFVQLGALRMVCDAAETGRKLAAEMAPHVEVVADVDEVLSAPVEGVVIATPAETHYDLTRQALEAGKDVLCEKPMGLIYEQGAELVRLAERQGRILMVGHVLEYHPGVVRLLELVRGGELGDVVIGNNVKIQNNVSVYSGVELEDDVFCGPSCVFTNVSNPRSQIVRHHLYERTLVRRGATLGANATIVCGVTIGRYAFVGAGAVVVTNVPDYALMLGVPARQKRWMSRHGNRLHNPGDDDIMICPESGWRYKEVEAGVLCCLDWLEDGALPVTNNE